MGIWEQRQFYQGLGAEGRRSRRARGEARAIPKWGSEDRGGRVRVAAAVQGVERILSRLGRAFDSTTDPRIAKAGGSRLKQAIEEGRVRVLSGTVEAELTGDRLLARGGGLTVMIPSVRAAWQSRTSTHVVLAASKPGVRPDFTKCVVLPADGRIATAIAGAPP